MNIAGIGLVFNRGRGVASLEKALEEGWLPPVSLELKGRPGARALAYPVAPETLDDKTVLAKARRADRFTRMAILSAFDAWTDSRLGPEIDKSRIGVILATAPDSKSMSAVVDGLSANGKLVIRWFMILEPR